MLHNALMVIPYRFGIYSAAASDEAASLRRLHAKMQSEDTHCI